MGDGKGNLNLDDVIFPTVPEGVVEDEEVLRLLLGAHAGLLDIYDRLIGEVDDDRRFLLVLLRSDWRKQCRDVLEPAQTLLDKIQNGKNPDEVGSRPSEEDATKLVERLKELDTFSFLAALEDVATRCAIGLQLVPLGGVSPQVTDLFRRCVGAEDEHLMQLAWLRETLSEEQTAWPTKKRRKKK